MCYICICVFIESAIHYKNTKFPRNQYCGKNLLKIVIYFDLPDSYTPYHIRIHIHGLDIRDIFLLYFSEKL